MQTAAEQTLTKIPSQQRRPYISANTWNLLQTRQETLVEGNYDKAKELTLKIKHEVRKDKEEHLQQQLEELEGNSYSWSGLKYLRSPPKLKFIKFRDKDGRRIPRSEYPHKAAEYLAQEQWKRCTEFLPESKINPTCLTKGKFPIDDSQFTMDELNSVIKKQSNNKAPGTDNLRPELVKFLDDQNRSVLLQHFNVIHETGTMEDSLHQASIVSIFKKGDSSKLENYRPISLLQTFYKLLAAIVKNRLAHGLEKWIMKTQYGFRQGKSTSHAIFLARRLQSFAEVTGKNIAIVLLDWEKAFDKVDHARLLESLRRLEVPPHLLNIIADIYSNPKFKVSNTDGASDFLLQQSGIRQGCPLSPYLFILVMSVVFTDIKSRLNTRKQLEPIPGIYFSEVLYADDTLIFGDHTASINKLLKEIETESLYYNLRLNYDKCINLTTNRTTSTIKFQNGTKVPRKKQAIYLGALITDSVNNAAEIQNRLAMAIKTCNQLKLFWNKARTTTAWKLRVLSSVVISKLMYGLETIQLTQNELNRLDAFQMKCLRRILKIPPTFQDRTQTNHIVFEHAKQHHANISKVSHIWMKQKLKLFGHILRADHTDPLRQVLFEYNRNLPRIPPTKRVGRPKQDWLTETIKDSFYASEGCRRPSSRNKLWHH